MEKKMKAFTLAETMIVIVVLGIIATLTIPTLVNKNKESVAKTKVKKAMAAYESALNKMIIENDLKSDTALNDWAGATANCGNPSNYFKKVQGDGCIFKTSDGIWWDISNIERPLIAFNQDNLTPAKANAENDMSAFVLVGRFSTDGSLRVDDLAYETGNGHADQNSDKQVTKLYTFLGMKKSTAGSGQTQSCDEGDIVCKYRRGDTLPACSGENRSCINYEYLAYDIGAAYVEDNFYIIYDENGNKVGGYKIGTDGKGNEYKEMEFYKNSENHMISTKRQLDDNGNSYTRLVFEGFDYNSPGAKYHTTQYKVDENGNSVITCSYWYYSNGCVSAGGCYEIDEDCSEAAMG